MKRFYAFVIRPVLEYGAQVWHGGLTKSQSNNIEKIKKRALRIICSEKEYDKLLRMAGVKSLYERRCDMCIELIRQMSQTGHKLHHLLPQKLCNIRQRETRLSGQLFYNCKYRTERLKNSPVVSSIELYNQSLNGC